MKKVLSLILLMLAAVFPAVAQNSTTGSSTNRVKLEISQKKDPATTVPRIPMHIDIEAFYDSESQTISVCYDGEGEGEAYLYLNENVVGYDSEINTSFQITSPGLCKIEIISESWIATGYIQL